MTASALVLVSCVAQNPQPESAGIDPVMRKFSLVEAQIESLVKNKGAREAIDYLDVTVKADPELEDVCHGLSHVIGDAAYARYGLEGAMRYDTDICGSGFIHGIIETYMAELDDVTQTVADFCPRTSGRCFHGIGHGLMDRSHNDVPGSLALCDTIPDKANAIQCAEGVFMENVEADPVVHPTKYLKDDDSFFPCRGRSKVHEGVCAFYAPRHFLRFHPKDYEATMDWCETLPEGPRDACIKGVGDIAMKQNIQKPLLVEELCGYANAERQKYCIEGLVSYYIVHHASAKKAGELCPSLREEHQASCRKVVAESVMYYPD